MAKVLRDTHGADRDELATKADLELLRGALRGDLAELKAELLKWISTLLIGQVAVLAALVKLL